MGLFSFLAVFIPVLASIMDIVHKVRDNPMWTAWLKRSKTTIATPAAQPNKPSEPIRFFWLDQTIAQVFSLMCVSLLVLKGYSISSSPATGQDVAIVGLLVASIVQTSSMMIRPISYQRSEYKFRENVMDRMYQQIVLLVALAQTNKDLVTKQEDERK